MSENESQDDSPIRVDPHESSIDDGDAADNSIIGKVKSRVSSIFPNTISKWFSPSSRDAGTDSCNGGINRRRRRFDDQNDCEIRSSNIADHEVEFNVKRRRGIGGKISNMYDGHEDSSDETNGSEEDTNSRICSPVVQQPPSKRSRLETDKRDGFNLQKQRVIDSTILNINNDQEDGSDDTNGSEEDANSRIFSSSVHRRQSSKRSRSETSDTRNIPNRYGFVSSTPATTSSAAMASVLPRNRNKHLNLYARKSIKEPAYNFSQLSASTSFSKTLTHSRGHFGSADVIDLVAGEGDDILEVFHSKMSSRRCLNIPSTYSEAYPGLTNLQHQPSTSVKESLPYSSQSGVTHGIRPLRTSTTIYDLENDITENNTNHHEKATAGPSRSDNENKPVEEGEEEEKEDDDKNNRTIGAGNNRHLELPDDNEEITEIAILTTKKRKYPNGVGEETTGGSMIGDTASESGESCRDSSLDIRQKSGLFKTVRGKRNVGGTRNSSRTSSMGNELNFYSHLEGRKSLFAEKNIPTNTMNNSTLSLTSLNRRQFNSSIYGSTSALSDSRLLNTSSPFYKGKTIYGGAAAYSKFANSGTSSSTSIRIAPTLIRPTSSLSTLSSNNSLNYNESGLTTSATAISNTAKRILELINDFPTPLSDAKKMATSLRTNTNQKFQQHQQRFSDADLSASRSVRLMNVRTPYTRSAVILNPANDSNKKLPPVKELQVPSMSQLLQMKRLQNTTERFRQIAKSRPSHESQYKLPVAQENNVNNSSKHINKIKNKITNSGRISSNKNSALGIEEGNEPSSPVNLPNIPFPYMESMPNIDITIPSHNKIAIGIQDNSSKEIETSNSGNIIGGNQGQNSKSAFAFNTSENEKRKSNDTATTTSSHTTSKTDSSLTTSSNQPSAGASMATFAARQSQGVTDATTFKFSSPLDLPVPTTNIGSMKSGNFTFSSPIRVDQKKCSSSIAKSGAVPTNGQELKTGSVVDVLKKSFNKASNEKGSVSASQSNQLFFCDNLRKPSNGWECSVCLLHNKEEQTICVACTASRNNTTVASLAASASEYPIKNSFGETFKPKGNTWNCPTCMITNKEEANKCVACSETKPQQKRNGNAENTNVPNLKIPTSSSSTFKSIAATQAAAKWECPACMAHNDDTRNKCICCEQAKPGFQSVKDVPSFSFGASSASKFSFGFGATSTQKESELRKQSTSTVVVSTSSENNTKTNMVMPEVTAVNVNSKPATGFKFGTNSDTVDSSTERTTTLKFDIDNKTTTISTGSTLSTSTEKSLPGYVLGNTNDVSSSSANQPKETSMSSSPSVKFNLPPSTTVEKKIEPATLSAPVAAPPTTTAPTTVSSFTLGAAANFKPFTSNMSGFSFGTMKPKENHATENSDSGFTFKPRATNNPDSSVAAAVATTNTFTFSSVDKPSTSIVAPVFGIASSSTTTTTAAKPSNFIFTNASAVSTASSASSSAPLTALNSMFKSPVSSSASATSSSTTGPNIFGSVPSATFTMAGAGSETVKNPFFAPTTAALPSTTMSGGAVFNTTSPTSSSFRAFTSNTESVPGTTSLSGTNTGNNLFSCFSPTTTTNTGDVAKTQLPLFGSSMSANKPFVFGSPVPATAPGSTATSTVPSSTTSSVSSWQKNSFIFGSGSNGSNDTAAIGTKPAASSTASIFGGFGSAQPTAVNSSLQSVPIFGQSPISTSNFGGATSVSSGGVFGSNSAPAATTGLFGSTPRGLVSEPPASAFGSSSPLTFGSVAPATPATFGSFSSGFGGGNTVATTDTSNDGSSASKKSKGFNFGNAVASQSAPSSGGFSFGLPTNNANSTPLSANKPASFNFGGMGSTTPTFNFTGSSEITNPSSQPFQFGAALHNQTPSTFNFSGGASEATPNAPFQFNAGTPSTVTSNIFAPPPTTGTQSAQQARRKIRPQIRRMTPR